MYCCYPTAALPRLFSGFLWLVVVVLLLEGPLTFIQTTLKGSISNDMTKKLSVQEKQTRKPIQKACVFCHEKHLQCDVGRPCQNCLRRNIGHECRDKERKRRQNRKKRCIEVEAAPLVERKRLATSKKLGIAKLSMSSARETAPLEVEPRTETHAVDPPSDPALATKKQEIDVSTPEISKIPSLTNLFDPTNEPFVVNDVLLPSYQNSTSNLRSTLEAPSKQRELHKVASETSPEDRISSNGSNFDSAWANNEYMKLNDILSTPGVVVNSRTNLHWSPSFKMDNYLKDLGSPRLSTTNLAAANEPGLPRTNSRPHISLDMASQHLAQSANDTTVSPDSLEKDQEDITPYRLRQLVKSPEELYNKQHLIKPHNYRAAYRDLLMYLRDRFLDNRGSQKNTSKNRDGPQHLQHIAHSIATHYAPIFVTLTTNLIENDLKLQELILQRTLLEYENMAKLVNCTPMCIWRRSGEICYVSNEFVSLTGFPRKDMLSKRRFILEFLDDESVVDYFDIFHEYLAFGSKEGAGGTSDGQAVFSECNLLLKNGTYLKCACIWTVKRDGYNIPLLVMGQFLPIFDIDQN